jgi:hypothetical protein
MSGARSAVSFVLPENKEFTRLFLEKKDNLSHEKDHLTTTLRSGEISEKVKDFLESRGFKSAGTQGSGVYRRELPDWKIQMYPDISHRYIAVRLSMNQTDNPSPSEGVKKSKNVSRRGAKLAKQTKGFFFATLRALAALRETLHSFTASLGEGDAKGRVRVSPYVTVLVKRSTSFPHRNNYEI